MRKEASAMEKEQVKHADTFLGGGFALILVYVALLSNVVVSVYDAGLQHVTGSGSLVNILEAVAYVPEWVGSLCYYGSMLLFNAALCQGLKQQASLSAWLKANVVLSAIMLLFGLLSSMIDEDSGAAVLLGLLALVLLVAYLVVQVCLGRRMMKRFEGGITAVGKWMMFSAIAGFVLNMLAVLVSESAVTFAMVLVVANLCIFYGYCNKLYFFLR